MAQAPYTPAQAKAVARKEIKRLLMYVDNLPVKLLQKKLDAMFDRGVSTEIL